MPTEDNAGVNADSAHSTDQTQNGSTESHSGSEKQEDKFDARHAFDKVNEKMNKMEEAYQKRIEELEENLQTSKGVTEEREKPDVETLIEQKLWRKDNKDRISEVEEDFKKYEKKGYSLPDALRLAEFDNGKSSDRKETKGAKASTADASIDRDVKPQMPESLKKAGWTDEDWAKYGNAKQVISVRGA